MLNVVTRQAGLGLLADQQALAQERLGVGGVLLLKQVQAECGELPGVLRPVGFGLLCPERDQEETMRSGVVLRGVSSKNDSRLLCSSRHRRTPGSTTHPLQSRGMEF